MLGKIVIATPFYEGHGFAPYIRSLADSMRLLDQAGIEHDYFQLSGDSYVDRAKNSIVHHFLKDPNATHLMMIDSDEGWDVAGFGRVVKAAQMGCEIVGALYPCKNNWTFYGGIPNVDNDTGQVMGKEVDGLRFLDMFCIPGGFVIYTRQAFERTRPVLDVYVDPETQDEILEAFRCNIEIDGLKRHTAEELADMDRETLMALVLANQRGGRKGRRIGEDIYFQQRYKEQGGKIWCVPNVHIKHIGVNTWEGSYHDHLCACRGIDPETGAAVE